MGSSSVIAVLLLGNTLGAVVKGKAGWVGAKQRRSSLPPSLPLTIAAVHTNTQTHTGITGFGSAIINLCVWVIATVAGINAGALGALGGLRQRLGPPLTPTCVYVCCCCTAPTATTQARCSRRC